MGLSDPEWVSNALVCIIYPHMVPLFGDGVERVLPSFNVLIAHHHLTHHPAVLLDLHTALRQSPDKLCEQPIPHIRQSVAGLGSLAPVMQLISPDAYLSQMMPFGPFQRAGLCGRTSAKALISCHLLKARSESRHRNGLYVSYYL